MNVRMTIALMMATLERHKLTLTLTLISSILMRFFSVTNV